LPTNSLQESRFTGIPIILAAILGLRSEQIVLQRRGITIERERAVLR
jgi:hypothetical protein